MYDKLYNYIRKHPNTSKKQLRKYAKKLGYAAGVKISKQTPKAIKKCKKKVKTEDVVFEIVKKGGNWKIKRKNMEMVDIAQGYVQYGRDNGMFYAESDFYDRLDY